MLHLSSSWPPPHTPTTYSNYSYCRIILSCRRVSCINLPLLNYIHSNAALSVTVESHVALYCIDCIYDLYTSLFVVSQTPSKPQWRSRLYYGRDDHECYQTSAAYDTVSQYSTEQQSKCNCIAWVLLAQQHAVNRKTVTPLYMLVHACWSNNSPVSITSVKHYCLSLHFDQLTNELSASELPTTCSTWWITRRLRNL